MRTTHLIATVAAGLLVAGAALGQAATEIYIPIGMSPGVSGKSSVIGFIKSVDVENKVLTVESASRTYTVQIDPETAIYLDRSSYRMKCLYGSIGDDCKVGLLCEVKYADQTRPEGKPCEWIKIQPLDPRRNTTPTRRSRR